MASGTEDEMEMDATYESEGRPDLRMGWSWTPRMEREGVQNRGWDGIGRYVWT